MSLPSYLRYIFTEIKAPLSFKITYAAEKFLKIPFMFVQRVFKKKVSMPYLFTNDYVLENRWGKWKIKAYSDYDYSINPMHEKGLESVFTGCRGIFLDIGAHIGKWSIVAGRTAKKAYAFEPTPEPYKYLLQNISLNGLTGKVVPVNKGVSSSRGEMTFEISPTNSSMSKIVQASTDAPTLTIPTTSIDEFLKEENIAFSDIELVKIDVEGHEFEVLKGMKHLLQQAKRIRIICEILPEQVEKAEIIRWMESLHFKTHELPTGNDFLFEK
ncbi:MAG TPA: FkbM family methyltransferase [Patescibacteria group bacterium]|nr:FkbM family methyltransferase [Patescibacteria group bacterium]